MDLYPKGGRVPHIFLLEIDNPQIFIDLAMAVKISKIGDSKRIILYSNILKLLDWELDDELELSIVGVNQLILIKK